MLVYFVRSLLEIPVSATIDIALLSKDKFGLNKHHNRFYKIHAKLDINTEVLAELENHDIRKIHQLTSYESNIQFDQLSSARQVFKSIRDKWIKFAPNLHPREAL